MEQEILKCEFCNKTMTQEDHEFCDICGDCRDENAWDIK
tara:strand:+ start:827 stop:943 length:117 start_codon:yes stop_codon:yes gene_type:complete